MFDMPEFFKKIYRAVGMLGTVSIVLFIAGFVFLYQKYEANKYTEREEIMRISESCIEKAHPIGDGHVFGLCEGRDMGLETHMIVYDTSDQISLPSVQRSDLWRYMQLRYYHGWETSIFQGEKIEGHFYFVSMPLNAGPVDQPILDFEKKYNCGFLHMSLTCKNFNPSVQ